MYLGARELTRFSFQGFLKAPGSSNVYLHLEMAQVRTPETLDYVHLLGLRKIIVGEPCSVVEPHRIHHQCVPLQRPTECPMKDGLGS